MSWYKKSQHKEYSIIIDFGDYSRTYTFGTKEEAIMSAKDIRGHRISENQWDSLGFTVTSMGFTYNDVFKGKLRDRGARIFDSNKRNRTINDDYYYSGPDTRSHFLGKRDYFSER
jgi:hypothetical protein